MKNPSFFTSTMIRCGVIMFTLAVLISCKDSQTGDGQLPGQQVHSWDEERAQREQQQATYIKDTTIKRIETDGETRTPWYSNQLGYEWFKAYPLAFNGVPFVLLRAVIEVYPDIWEGEGSLGKLGFGPHPDDYDPESGKLLPPEQRHPLPYGFFTVPDTDVPEDSRTDNVFFSCSACHTGRVYVKDRVRHFIGAPNSEIDAQAYAKLLYQTGKKLIKVNSDPSKIEVNSDEVAKIATFLQSKVEADPTWFYGGKTPEQRLANAERAKVQVARILSRMEDAAQILISSAKKTELMYLALASKLMYTDKDGQKAPDVFGPRPGRMDAFGIAAGLVALHAKRDSFFARLPDDHPFFAGLENLSKEERIKQAGERLFKTAAEWMPHDPGASDIKSLWFSRDHGFANWDSNQAPEARVLASGVSSVGDPSKVNVRIHEAMNPFINDLPPAPYPFTVDLNLAAKGKPLFEQQCASACHFSQNKKVYKVGTDMNRATQITPKARLGLLELTREACELYVEKEDGSDWCLPKRGSRAADDEAYFITPRGEESGYKADVLHGIWAQAPYLHNGSVPTLWHLFRPAERPAKFIRGNIRYDEEKVGFIWDKAPALDEYGPGDTVHFAEHDTTLRGNSNAGHTYGSEWNDDQVRAVIEYMKTL